jgi:hypothetical protein
MSSSPIPRLAAIALAALALACGSAAVAAIGSLDDAVAEQLTASADPPMLGPITSAGRVGWACKPERAAGARAAREAELPADPGTP